MRPTAALDPRFRGDDMNEVPRGRLTPPTDPGYSPSMHRLLQTRNTLLLALPGLGLLLRAPRAH